MGQPNGESDVSIGSIAERADKLEAAKPAEVKTEEVTPKGDETPVTTTETTKVEDKKPEVTPKAEEKKPEVPVELLELRKWATKTSMENAEIKKQIQAIAEAVSKSTKKAVDWKDLAKDPAKLQAAVDELNAQTNKEWQEKYDAHKYSATAKITQKENQRRFHDPNYPRWQELNPIIVKMAANADSRVDFEKEPDEVLDMLYQFAQEDVAKDPNYKAPAAPPTPRSDLKYSEVELQAKLKEAVEKASAEAAKGLKAEEGGAGVGGMGKGAPKGKGGVDKAALWNMPMEDLKAAIQQASDK
jgi:hypothetical protein